MEIARRVKAAGNTVAVVSREAELKSKAIPIYELRFAGESIPFLRNMVFPPRSLRTLRNFDLVHTQYHPGIFAGDLAAVLLKKPHVFTFHGFAPIRAWRNPKQTLKMVDHRLGTFAALRSNVHKIITVSHFLKAELIKRYFVDESMIRVIYNGVDLERFTPNVSGGIIRKRYNLGKRPVILYLGRLAPYKGVQFLIKAIPEVLKELPEAKFLIGGGVRYDTADLYGLVKRSKIGKSVIFTGYVSDQDVRKLYATCDVFCYPSLWEGFGLEPAEAHACGKPVVAFHNCALPEVVHDGCTGVLVPPRSVEALAEALISLLHDEERRIHMGHAARKRVSRLFSWEKAADQTLEVYHEAFP